MLMNTESYSLYSGAVWERIELPRMLLLFIIGSVLCRLLVTGLQNIATLSAFLRPQKWADDAAFTLSMLPTFSLFQR